MNVKDGHMRAASTRRDRADASRRSTRRRLILAAAAWPALAWTGALFAQSKPPILIGWLNSSSREADGRFLAAFKEGMAALGWKEGPHFVIEERWADGRVDRLRALAEELVARKPAIIVAALLPAVAAAAKAAPKTPIVIANGHDPVAAGLAKSLARPGGMVTGVTNIATDVSEKYLELLLAAAPKLRRVGFLIGGAADSSLRAANLESARRSVERYRVEGSFAEAARPEDIEPAISRLARDGAQALIVMVGAFVAQRQRIVKLALTHRWPVVAGAGEFAEAGALLSYGADRSALYRRAAYYVDRILKGAKPGDLPIEQPMRFELVVNMKTAKALKLEIPPELAVRADRVIE